MQEKNQKIIGEKQKAGCPPIRGGQPGRRKSYVVAIGPDGCRGAVNTVGLKLFQRPERGGQVAHRNPYAAWRENLQTLVHSRVMKSLLA